MLYLIRSLDQIPNGTRYRLIGESCPWWDGKHLVEIDGEFTPVPVTVVVIDGVEYMDGINDPVELAPEKYPNGNDVDDLDGCIIDWQIKGSDNG